MVNILENMLIIDGKNITNIMFLLNTQLPKMVTLLI